MIARCTIPLKLPGLNEYVKACRTGPIIGARMKRQTQNAIGWYMAALPEIRGRVWITFAWTEKTRRRDYDNVAAAKKFILDELVELGKLEDDSRRFVAGFTDTFALGDDWGVEITIEEVNDDREETGSGGDPRHKGRG